MNTETTPQPEQIRPSKLQSIKACPGYRQDNIYNEDGTQYQSDAAERGTNLHKWMEDYISSGCKPKALPLAAEDAEALDYCREALELQDDVSLNAELTAFECEKEIDLTWIGLPELKKGTVDLVVYSQWVQPLETDTYEAEACNIIDYKFGRVEVHHPKDNMQAKAYVAGMFHLHPEIQEIAFMFIIPFLRKTVSHVFYPEDVADLILDIRTTVTRWRYLKNNVAAYAIGDQCVYCSRKPTCPLMQDLAITTATQFGIDTLLSSTPVSNNPEAEKLKYMLDAGKTLSEWYESVRAYAAIQVESGMVIPGYKMMSRRSGEKIISAYMAYKILNDMYQTPHELFLDACSVSFKSIDKALSEAGITNVDRDKVYEAYKDAFIISEEHVTKYIQKGRGK